MPQCEHYPKHENNQFGNCRGQVLHCLTAGHNHWLCDKHYSVLPHMKEIGEK